MSKKEHFLKLIEDNPTDYSHRYVYADWLDEHGDHDEADRQRKYEGAYKWLTDYANNKEWTEVYGDTEFTERFGSVIAAGEYGGEWPRGDEDYELIKLKDGREVYIQADRGDYRYESNPYTQLVYFLGSHLDEKYFYLPFETPTGFNDYTDELWTNFEIVTGLKRPEGKWQKEMPPFSCSC